MGRTPSRLPTPYDPKNTHLALPSHTHTHTHTRTRTRTHFPPPPHTHTRPQVGDQEYGAQDFYGLVEEMRVWKVGGAVGWG